MQVEPLNTYYEDLEKCCEDPRIFLDVKGEIICTFTNSIALTRLIMFGN
jgi:hypothetical protein